MTLQMNDLDRCESAPVLGAHTEAEKNFPALYRDFGKRALDLTVVFLLLPIILPLILIFCALIALDGHSPIYMQNRVGRGGRIFRMYKLRTMIPDAKAGLSKYLAENPSAMLEWELKQKLSNDPRITVVGRILRSSSLDELPQLLNVLKGDMSLIGPRPMMIEQMPMYPGSAYYHLRPGVTGTWQVSDRNNSSFAGRAPFDTSYHRDLSLWVDIRVLFQTALVVIRRTGC